MPGTVLGPGDAAMNSSNVVSVLQVLTGNRQVNNPINRVTVGDDRSPKQMKGYGKDGHELGTTLVWWSGQATLEKKQE